jgi:hypothetical protein
MGIFWVLFAMPALGLLYTACVIIRDGRSVSGTGPYPLHSPSLHSTAGMTSDVSSYREVRQISTKDLRSLAHKSDDLILVDLRLRSEREPISFHVAHVLFVSSNDLVDLLCWLPPASSVVLYGGTDRCTSAIRVGQGIFGTAPIYVLREPARYSIITQETYEESKRTAPTLSHRYRLSP